MARERNQKKIDKICKEKENVCEKLEDFFKWFHCNERLAYVEIWKKFIIVKFVQVTCSNETYKVFSK
jgi:hypothetical protein